MMKTKRLLLQEVVLCWAFLFGLCMIVLSCVADDRAIATPAISVLQPSPPETATSQPVSDSTWISLPSGVSGEVAYLSNRTGLSEIWFLDLTTGVERRLTHTKCCGPYASCGGGSGPDWYQPGVERFAWSPDGKKIAYLTTCSTVGHLAHQTVLDVESGSIISFTDHVSTYSYPSWAPTGDRFIFAWSSNTSLEEGMYIAALDGRNSVDIMRFTHAREGYYFPVWSPGGDYIAYRGPYIGVASRTYVSIIDLNGDHVVYTDTHQGERTAWIAAPALGSGLTWSKTGRYLAVATAREYVPGSLRLVELEGGTATIYPTRLTSYYFEEMFGLDFFSPVFSPDEKTLYFVATWPDAEFGWPLGTIYSTEVERFLAGEILSVEDIQVISPVDQLAGLPDLSSDGKWLLYTVKEGKGTEVWLQSVDGSYRQPLIVNGSVNWRSAWRP